MANIKEVYPNIYQIEDYATVHMTLIKGEKLSILWDMGYGIRDTKKLIDGLIDTDLVVIASHGHPDHTLGCTFFDEIYLSSLDYELFKESNGKESRKKYSDKFLRRGIYDDKECEDYINRSLPKVKFVNEGDVFDLGNFHARIVALPGHTAGSIGLLILEARILLTGDAICNDLWLFLPESLKIDVSTRTLSKVLDLPFDNFLVAHKEELYPKKHVYDILDNLKNIKISDSLERTILHHFDVYESKSSSDYGEVSILYTEEKL